MKVLIDKDNVVIAKGNIEDLGDGNFKAHGSIFGANLELTLIETTCIDAEIIPQRDKIVNDVKETNNSHQAWLEEEKEKAREEIRKEVRDAEALGTISEQARVKLVEKGILK